jgi:hypothetical protein
VQGNEQGYDDEIEAIEIDKCELNLIAIWTKA